MKLACVVLFIAACALLYFGSGMLLFVPGYPGENYFALKRVIYGVLPALGSVGLLTLVSWLWVRPARFRDLKKSVLMTYSLALVAVALFWLGLMIIGSRGQVS